MSGCALAIESDTHRYEGTHTHTSHRDWTEASFGAKQGGNGGEGDEKRNDDDLSICSGDPKRTKAVATWLVALRGTGPNNSD